jgi:hypothetical protein
MWITLFIFLLIPICSLAKGIPGLEQPLLDHLFFWLPYWVLPIGICVTIIYGHFLFLYLYLFEISLLTPNIFVGSIENINLQEVYASFFSWILLIIVGSTIVKKDFIVSAINGQKHYWRAEKRFPVTVKVKISDDENQINAAIEDITSDGMAIATSSKKFKSLFPTTNRHSILNIKIKHGPIDETVPMKLMWKNSHFEFERLGLLAEDKSKILAFHEHMLKKNVGMDKLSRYLTVNWSKPIFTRTFLVFYILNLAIVLWFSFLNK